MLERPKSRIQGRDPFQMLRHLYEKGIVTERARALTGTMQVVGAASLTGWRPHSWLYQVWLCHC